MRDIKKLIVMVVMVAALSACASTDVQKTSNAQKLTAQDFTLPDSNGKLVKLSDVLKDYRGAVIAFYPKDDSKN
jgi:peroxiredoxin